MAQLFKNFAKSTLLSALNSADTTITVQVADATKFPSPGVGDYFDVVVQNGTDVEIIRCDGRTSNVIDISARAQESTTTPASFAIGSVISLRLTAAAIESTMAHPADTSAAHAASAISNTPAGGITETNVQDALDGLDTRKASSSDITTAVAAHVADGDPHTQYALESDVTASLAGKANSSHAHSAADITSGTLAVARGGTGKTTLGDAVQDFLDAISTTQGTVLYRNATDWVALAPGTSGQFLKTLGAASNPVWGTLSVGTGEQTITSGDALTIAHDLGVIPKLAVSWLTCTSDELGYSNGDKLLANIGTAADLTRDYGASVVVDASNVYIRYGSNANAFVIPRKDTGAQGAITNTKWTFSVEVMA